MVVAPIEKEISRSTFDPTRSNQGASRYNLADKPKSRIDEKSEESERPSSKKKQMQPTADSLRVASQRSLVVQSRNELRKDEIDAVISPENLTFTRNFQQASAAEIRPTIPHLGDDREGQHLNLKSNSHLSMISDEMHEQQKGLYEKVRSKVFAKCNNAKANLRRLNARSPQNSSALATIAHCGGLDNFTPLSGGPSIQTSRILQGSFALGRNCGTIKMTSGKELLSSMQASNVQLQAFLNAISQTQSRVKLEESLTISPLSPGANELKS